jgi:hypothetical protein
MHIVAVAAGVGIIVVVLSDAFATIVLPRRVNQRFSPSRLVLLIAWRFWTGLARHLPGGVGREGAGRQSDFLSIFGPLALLGLVGLWATGLVVGFAVLLWGIQGPIAGTASGQDFGTLVYLSGTTFFTVGFGDITPTSGIGRALAVIEGGTGLGFLAVVVSYLPTIFGAAARREAAITLLDARAGSPPTAAGLLSRLGPDPAALVLQLREWEQWAADLLETHLSYPILAFFRSQHERQSWLAALVVILDVSALVHVGVTADGQPILSRQARLTFAMARHVVGDLCQILDAPPHLSTGGRLTPADWEQVRRLLSAHGLELTEPDRAEQHLAAMRALYEPYVAALAERTLLTLPPWVPAGDATDDWQTTAWQPDPCEAIRAVDGAPQPSPVGSADTNGAPD